MTNSRLRGWRLALRLKIAVWAWIEDDFSKVACFRFEVNKMINKKLIFFRAIFLAQECFHPNRSKKVKVMLIFKIWIKKPAFFQIKSEFFRKTIFRRSQQGCHLPSNRPNRGKPAFWYIISRNGQKAPVRLAF